MSYNLDFLYAALVICVAVGAHAFISKRNFRSLIPIWVQANMALSAFVALIDIFDSLFIEFAYQVDISALYLANTLLYVAQITVPLVLYLFTLRILGFLIKGQTRKVVYLPIVLYVLMVVFIVTTPWTGWVFSFQSDAAHTYVHGWGLYTLYGSAIVIGICVLALVLSNCRYLRLVDAVVICLDVAITALVPVVQTLIPGLCLVGFGAALGSLLLYLSFNDQAGLGDAKTGAFETAEFRRRISALLNRDVHFNIIFITIENTRALNNSIGPDVVDEAMRYICHGLMSICKTEQVYKLQGSRFCVLSYDDGDTQRLRPELQSWMTQSHYVQGGQISFEARVAVLYSVCAIAGDVDIETFMDFLLEKTEIDTDGHIDQQCMVRQFAEFREANVALERALSEDSFEIFLQPLYTVACGSYQSAEVLSRLKDSQGRYIPPFRFIEIAEDSGSINELSRLQFLRLCRFLSEHHAELEAAGVRDIKWNVSALETNAANRGKTVLNCIRSFGLDPALFSFEVTESAAYTNSETLLSIMRDVQAAGCRVYMDDFGSGYANMETIFQLPFDGIKLDISLLRLAARDEKAANFYHGLVDMIHTLDKVVISEGVETEEEAKLLTEWGVDVFQGFYYSKPLPTDDFCAFVAASQK